MVGVLLRISPVQTFKLTISSQFCTYFTTISVVSGLHFKYVQTRVSAVSILGQ